MRRSGLAKLLIEAKTAADLKDLLAENRPLADEKLALAIKDACYAAWAAEPTVAQKAARALKALQKFNPDRAVEAYSLWVSGISDLTRGRLESAIDNLNNAGSTFFGLGRELESAQARVATLIALAMLGRYDEAVKTGESILKILDKYGDQTAAGRIELNLGNIVSRRDLHQKAEKYYLSARDRFKKAGDTESQIMAENGLAITYAQLNDFRHAEKVFAGALETARSRNMLLTEAEIEASMGNLALFRGRYDEALKYLELSRRKYDELDMPHQRAVAGLEIADVYRELNLTGEALDVYREVADTFKTLKLQGEEARARANLGRAALTLGRVAFARTNLKRSAALYEREKNKTGAAATRLIRAELEIAQDKPEAALPVIREAEKLLAASDSVQKRLMLKLLKAEALAATGQKARAEKILNDTAAEAGVQEQPNIELAAFSSLGRLARGRGDNKSAKKWFTKAVEITETLREPIGAEEFRMSFLAGKLEPFESLASIHIAEKHFDRAFLFTEKARSRALAEMLAGGRDDVNKEIPKAFALELGDLREELNWYYSRLSRASDGDVAALQNDIRLKEKEIARLMRRIESTTRSGGDAARDIDVVRLQKRLGTDKVLIEFIEIDGVFSAFVIDGEMIQFIKGLAAANEIAQLLEGLQFQFGSMRYGKEFRKKHADVLMKRTRHYFSELGRLLIEPLRKFIDGRPKLVIVPAGLLYYVPFAAVGNGSCLASRHDEIVHSPSAAIWLALDEKPRRMPKNALLMGYADESIPLVNKEIRTIGRILPSPASLTGKDATFAAYTANAPRFDLLHLACHGQFRPENPLFSSLHLADGWVTVRDICAQKLKAGLVTLSACETGMNEIFAGDEILGLARGFLAAGASSLVLSLWTVDDEATQILMKLFYENLQRGHTPAASLKIAQSAFIDREHPYFWSSFILIGR